MNDRVVVHLYFDTTTPPPGVARGVMDAVIDRVPDKLDSIHWGDIDLDDEAKENQ